MRWGGTLELRRGDTGGSDRKKRERERIERKGKRKEGRFVGSHMFGVCLPVRHRVKGDSSSNSRKRRIQFIHFSFSLAACLDGWFFVRRHRWQASTPVPQSLFSLTLSLSSFPASNFCQPPLSRKAKKNQRVFLFIPPTLFAIS